MPRSHEYYKDGINSCEKTRGRRQGLRKYEVVGANEIGTRGDGVAYDLKIRAKHISQNARRRKRKKDGTVGENHQVSHRHRYNIYIYIRGEAYFARSAHGKEALGKRDDRLGITRCNTDKEDGLIQHSQLFNIADVWRSW